MTEIILDKIVFTIAEKYNELFFFTAFGRDQSGCDLNIQGLSTPELNEVIGYT